MGIFDFNRDGKDSLFEKIIGYIGYNIVFGNDKKDYDGYDSYDYDDSWRDICEDGSEYGIDPEDYDCEEDYNYALEESMNKFKEAIAEFKESVEEQLNYDGYDDDDSWLADCEDGLIYGLDPEDYDCEEDYKDALIEAMENDFECDYDISDDTYW